MQVASTQARGDFFPDNAWKTRKHWQVSSDMYVDVIDYAHLYQSKGICRMTEVFKNLETNNFWKVDLTLMQVLLV